MVSYYMHNDPEESDGYSWAEEWEEKKKEKALRAAERAEAKKNAAAKAARSARRKDSGIRKDKNSRDEGYLGIGLDTVEEEVFFWDDDD